MEIIAAKMGVGAIYQRGNIILNNLKFLRNNSVTSVLQSEIEKNILGGDIGPGDRLGKNALAARIRSVSFEAGSQATFSSPASGRA